MTKLAGLHLRKGQYVAHSWSLTTDRLWVANGLFDLLDAQTDNRELGKAVRRMLDASRSGVPTPDLRTGPSPFAPVLSALGLRSYRTYAKDIRIIHIEQDGDNLVVTPHHNGGPREGFVGIPEQAIGLTNPADEELGHALRTALDRCT